MRPGRPLGVAIETPDGSPIQGRVRDVSLGGLGVALGSGLVFQPGDELILQVTADPSQRLLATARVVWAQPREDGAHLGLLWTHRGPNRERLAAWVASAAQEQQQSAGASPPPPEPSA